jgi:hypothetical protein
MTEGELAEGVGFEPTREQNPLPVFKTGALNHSATLPSHCYITIFLYSEFTKKPLATEIATERGDFVLPAPVIALRNTLSSWPPRPALFNPNDASANQRSATGANDLTNRESLQRRSGQKPCGMTGLKLLLACSAFARLAQPGGRVR